jgi:predicted RNA-binding protein with RPS1 domain
MTQEGQCLIYSEVEQMFEAGSGRGVKEARNAIMELVADVEAGTVYQGTVLEIKDFGAVVEIMRNKEGLLHVSELTNDRALLKNPKGNIGIMESLMCVGQKVDFLCKGVDMVRGHIRLSRKALVDGDSDEELATSKKYAEKVGADSAMKERRHTVNKEMAGERIRERRAKVKTEKKAAAAGGKRGGAGG